MRSLLGRFHRPMSRGAMGDMLTMNSLGDGSTLSLDFTTGVLDSRLTFTRSTTATYINSSGYVTSAAINAPRFDYSPTNIGQPRGLLIEGQTTNLARRTDDFNTVVTDGSQWVSSGYTVGTLSTQLPDGSTGNARRISIASGSGAFFSQQITVTASTEYTFSFWARNNGGSQARYRVWNATAASSIVDATLPGSNYVSLIGGANNTSSTWVRISVTFTTPVGCTAIIIYPTSTTSGSVDVLVWGAQLELGSGASSYIPTGASQVTRAVDTAIIAAGTNFSSWYTGGTTGTFVTEWCRCSPTTTQRTVIATSDVSNQHLHQYIAATTSRLRLADKVPAFIETANASVDNSINKGAFSYSGSVQSLCLNGGTVVPGTLTFTIAPTWLSIGGPSTNGTSITDTAVVLNNAIRKIKYFPARLSDAQIKEITT